MLSRSRLLLPLVLLSLGLGVAPASASRWTAPDPAGDTVETIHSPDPAPCGTDVETPVDSPDLRRLTVRHGPHNLHLRARVLGLGDLHGLGAYFNVKTRAGQWGLFLDLGRGRTEVSFIRWPEFDDEDGGECGLFFFASTGRCPRATGLIDPSSGSVVATVPRTCLGSPSAVRVSAQISGSVAGSYGWRSDFWSTTPGDSPRFGPRVPSGSRSPSRPGRSPRERI